MSLPAVQPSPYTPERRFPITCTQEGVIKICLSPGHKHRAIYTFERTDPDGTMTVYVGASQVLKDRVARYNTEGKKLHPVVALFQKRCNTEEQEVVRNLNPLIFDMISNPQSFTFGYRTVSSQVDLAKAERAQIEAKENQGYGLYNRRAGGGGLRSDD